MYSAYINLHDIWYQSIYTGVTLIPVKPALPDNPHHNYTGVWMRFHCVLDKFPMCELFIYTSEHVSKLLTSSACVHEGAHSRG